MALELADINRYYDELKIRGKSKAIIGNEKQRVFISLMYPLRKQSFLIGGEAGSAKSCLLKGMATMVWGEGVLDDEVPEVIVVSAMSGKGFLTGDMEQRVNNEAMFCIAPELQNWVRGGNDNTEDLVKAWGEGEPYIYSRNDMTTDTTKRYSFRSLPIATSLANENARLKELGEELERRLLNVWTESNVKLNERVKERKAACVALPDEVIYKGGLAKAKEIQEAYKDMIWKNYGHTGEDALLTPAIKNPGALYMARAIPSKFTISNTLVDAWHELIFGVTQFYAHDRLMLGDKPFNKRLLGTPADNYMAWVIGGDIFVFASLRVKDIGKVLLDLVPLRTFEGEGLRMGAGREESVTLDQIVDRLQLKGIERSKSQVKDIVNKMVMSTYIKTDGRDNYWKSRDYSGEFTHALNWAELTDACAKIVKEHYPEGAKDYIRRFCEDPECRHPLTGEKIKLLDLTPESAADLKKRDSGKATLDMGAL